MNIALCNVHFFQVKTVNFSYKTSYKKQAEPKVQPVFVYFL